MLESRFVTLASIRPQSMTDQNDGAWIDSRGNLQHGLCHSFGREPDGDKVRHRQWEGWGVKVRMSLAAGWKRMVVFFTVWAHADKAENASWVAEVRVMAPWTTAGAEGHTNLHGRLSEKADCYGCFFFILSNRDLVLSYWIYDDASPWRRLWCQVAHASSGIPPH